VIIRFISFFRYALGGGMKPSLACPKAVGFIMSHDQAHQAGLDAKGGLGRCPAGGQPMGRYEIFRSEIIGS
jgi:hypothetical protein